MTVFDRFASDGFDDANILIDEDTIQSVVDDVADRIDADYENRTPVLVVILNGAFIFAGDLVRSLTVDAEVEFMRVSSYHGKIDSSGEIKLVHPPQMKLQDRDIIIVEDIVDTAGTIQYLKSYLKELRPRSIRVCSLLLKDRSNRDVNNVRQVRSSVLVDYVGMVVPNVFLVGYGLDYQERYRGLPDIWWLERSELSS